MSGVWYGIAAYSIWGLLTLYWRLFPDVPAIQVLGHRIVWAFVVLAAIIAASWPRRRQVVRLLTPRSVGLYAIAAGGITVVPLLLFASAVRRVPLSVIGILQYIAPTIQFLLGVFLVREPFTKTQLSGFILVWLGLVVFGLDGVRTRRGPALTVIDEGAA